MKIEKMSLQNVGRLLHRLRRSVRMLTQDNKTRIDRPIPVGLPINQNAHKHLIGPKTPYMGLCAYHWHHRICLQTIGDT